MDQSLKLVVAILLLMMSCNSRIKDSQLTKTQYFDTAKYLWQTYVPKSGQAETVQGELIRCIEKLADEAQRNGNINFNHGCHVILIEYLREHLSDDKIFSKETIAQINRDLNALSIEDEPYIEDDIYDRITDRIVDWYQHYKTPIPHQRNPRLYC